MTTPRENPGPTVLCPIDFSESSRGALRYARAVAEHFGARLLVMTVEDPLLTEAVDFATGVVWDPAATEHELAHFTARVVGKRPPSGVTIAHRIEVGKPAPKILEVAGGEAADLIVMSTHGLTGVRKLFFGSTTERVLRETTVPVLATPGDDEGPQDLADARQKVGRIVVPVDLTAASSHQVRIAVGLAEALSVPLILTHVVEPVRSPLAAKLHLPGIERERRSRAEDTLRELLAMAPPPLQAEAIVAYGDPAEEITKLAADRRAGLIVVGLHGSPLLGPRMGSVTYRVLCLAHSLVLALPPHHVHDRYESPPPARQIVV
jgi:nucleotide-binding universal stress UspA family protein